MKRFWMLCLILLLALSLTACGSKTEPPAAEVPAAPPVPAAPVQAPTEEAPQETTDDGADA